MANNNIDDKWLIVYQGTLDFYKKDYNIDSYKNKLVLVTGDKTASGERDQTSYLCIDNDTHSVNIPIPAIYLRGIGIGKNTYGFPDSILKFASANGINVSFSGGAVTIGINNDTLGKIDSIDNKVEQTVYDAKVAELEASIVSKYTKPAEGIPAKDLANEVATNEEVTNAISVVATDLNNKIDSKVGKTDLKDLKYTVNGTSSTYNGLSEATMPQIFTPTSRGVNGQILQSKGGSTPEWTDLSDIKEAIGITDDTLTKINTAIQEIEPLDNDYITIYDKVGTDVTTKVIGANTASINGNGKGLATAEDVRASMPTKLPNPKSLKLAINGIPTKLYNGDTETELKIFAPTDVGTNNQVIKCRDGVMADWGYVKWAEIQDKPDVINFANDLTGVLEATPEEFTYRPSAGNKSIRDESAVIRRIKGNTTVWNQHLQNDGISAGDKYVDIVQDDTEWSGNLQNMDSGCDNPWKFGIKVPTLKKTVGHKYLLVMDAMVSRIASSYYNDTFSLAWGNEVFDVNVQMNEPSKWQSLSCVFSTNIASEDTYSLIRPPWCFTYSLGGKNGDYYKVKNAQLFDLTSIFGAGNEPTTLVEFKKIYSESYYPYCVPEIRSMKTWWIKTVGFNLFNKNSAVVGALTSTGSIDNTSSFTKQYFTAKLKVLPNTTYYLLNVSNYYHYRSYVFYDAFDNVISSGGLQAGSSGYNASGTVTTPNNAAYMGVVVHNTFIDQCCINFSHSGVRNGEYEPYKENTLLLPEIANYFSDGMNGIGDVYDEINSENAIQRCGIRRYVEGDENDANVRTDGENTVYILATPIVTPILEPIQLVYDVEDFGTERAIAPENSAPFRADIVYQFNAEGRIRDNGRNIERLEKSTNILNFNIEGLKGRFDDEFVVADGLLSSDGKYYYLPSLRSPNQLFNLATEQYVINSIPTEVATATQKLQANISLAGALNASPNIVYEFPSPLSVLTIETLQSPSGDYDHVWIIRFSRGQIFNITIKPTVRWKDGIAPTFETNTIYELIFKQFNNQTYFGEWKAYKQ